MQIIHTLAEVPKICTDWAGILVCPSAGSKAAALFSHISVSLMIRHCSLHTERIKAELDICSSLCFIDKRGGNAKSSSLHGDRKKEEKDVGMNFFIHSHNTVLHISLHFLLLLSRSTCNRFQRILYEDMENYHRKCSRTIEMSSQLNPFCPTAGRRDWGMRQALETEQNPVTQMSREPLSIWRIWDTLHYTIAQGYPKYTGQTWEVFFCKPQMPFKTGPGGQPH